MVGSFGRKPSRGHVVWSNRPGEAGGKKRFDFTLLERWAEKYGVEYDERRRVDHDRSSEPQDQHLVVFAWTKTDAETLELGEDTWELPSKKTPRTFFEMDELGQARIQGWEREAVVDVQQLWFEGPWIHVTSADSGQVTVDSRKFRRDWDGDD